MVAGDRNGDLVGNRGDVQIAVHHNNLDVAVVCGGDHEVILGQAHLVVANACALRHRFGAFGQHHADCLCSHVGREAGHTLLTGVVDLAVMVAGDRNGDLGRRRNHRQSAMHISDSIIADRSLDKGVGGNLIRHRAFAWVGDGACDCRVDLIIAYKSVHAVRRIAVRLSIIFELFVLCGNRHRFGVDLQGSVVPGDGVSPADILTLIGDGQTGNGVRNLSIGHIGDAAGDLHRQNVAVREGINTSRADRNRITVANLECIAVLAVGAAVVGPALAAGRHGDLHRIRIAHRQGAVLSGNTVVSSSTRRKLIALQDILHRALARIGDAAFNHSGDRVGAYQPIHRIVGVAVRLAIVLKGFAGRDDLHCLRVDLQGSVVSGDGVSPADILTLIGDGQTGNGVRNLSIGHIGDAAGDLHRQNVAVREGINTSRADRNRITVANLECIAVLAVGAAVVGPALVVGRHGDGLRRTIGHGQLSNLIADSVVAGIARGKGMAGDLVPDGALARVGDAARDRRGNRVTADKAGHRIGGVAVRAAVIGEGFVRSFDCHRFGGHFELAVDGGDLIFAGYRRRAALNGIARHGIGALARVGLAAGDHNRQNVAVFKGINAVRADLNRSAAVNGQLIAVRRQSSAVIGSGASVRRNDENGLCFPDGIEVVFAVVVKADLRADSMFRFGAAFGSAPAEELIIGLRLGKAAAFQRKHRMLIVVAEAAHHIRIDGRAVRIIRMIADRNRRRSIAPLRVKDDILGADVKLILGIIGVAAAVGLGIPAQEDLVRRCGHAGGSHDLGIAVLRIVLGVRGRAAAAVRVIRNGKGRRADIVGIKSDVAVNLGIKVEGGIGVIPFGAGADGPADPLGPGGDLFMHQGIFVDGAAVRNLDGIGGAVARHRHMDGAGKGRGSPLGVDHHITGRHRGQIVSSLGSVLAGG